MKPFNLEEALAGKPVVTLIGQEVTQLTIFNAKKSNTNLVGVVDGNIESWTTKGKYLDQETSLDLFMKTEKKTVWIVINNSDQSVYKDYFSSKESAEAAWFDDCKFYPVEIEV